MSAMKRSACRRIFRNCHHLRKMRYHEMSEKTARMASTNFVSRLDVSTSSHGVVGTARPTWSSSTVSPPESAKRSVPIPGRVRPVPQPGAFENLFEARMARTPAQQLLRAAQRGHEKRRVARAARVVVARDRVPGHAPRRLDHRPHRMPGAGAEIHGGGAIELGVERSDVRVGDVADMDVVAHGGP